MILHWTIGLLLILGGASWIVYVWCFRFAFAWFEVWSLSVPALASILLGMAIIYWRHS